MNAVPDKSFTHESRPQPVSRPQRILHEVAFAGFLGLLLMSAPVFHRSFPAFYAYPGEWWILSIFALLLLPAGLAALWNDWPVMAKLRFGLGIIWGFVALWYAGDLTQIFLALAYITGCAFLASRTVGHSASPSPKAP